MAYSEDLRERAVAYARKHGPVKAALAFKVGRRSLQRWLLSPTQIAGKPGPTQPRKVDLTALQAEVEANPEGYLVEFAEKLAVSASTISRHLKRLKLSRKKKPAVQGKK